MFRSLLTQQFRPFDAPSRLLVFGVLGLLAILLGETLAGWLGFGHSLASSFYDAAKATTTVGPDTVADDGPHCTRSSSASRCSSAWSSRRPPPPA